MRILLSQGFPGGSVIKNLPANAGDAGHMGSIAGSGGTPGGGNGNPLQYSWPVNPMDRGAWCATVQRVTKSRTQLSRAEKQRVLASTYCVTII